MRINATEKTWCHKWIKDNKVNVLSKHKPRSDREFVANRAVFALMTFKLFRSVNRFHRCCLSGA